ncbi:hypothetical protein BDD12DRAFT_819398 [Trichophaea hybrida]|nr:hypothetical protein BDD12DRAFT_819398 [Trichophaea hybrida]
MSMMIASMLLLYSISASYYYPNISPVAQSLVRCFYPDNYIAFGSFGQVQNHQEPCVQPDKVTILLRGHGNQDL